MVSPFFRKQAIHFNFFSPPFQICNEAKLLFNTCFYLFWTFETFALPPNHFQRLCSWWHLCLWHFVDLHSTSKCGWRCMWTEGFKSNPSDLIGSLRSDWPLPTHPSPVLLDQQHREINTLQNNHALTHLHHLLWRCSTSYYGGQMVLHDGRG